MQPTLDNVATKLLFEFLQKDYKSKVCYPAPHLIFNAFNTAHFADLKVVIVGQDPYI